MTAVQAPRADPTQRPIAVWLLVVAALVFAMAVIGAITRLTGSGLSIAVWEPIVGALPPLDAADWERLFALYRDIPQYKLRNAGMTLAEFKQIFWWEYAHRLWGRLIGLAYAVPLFWFWARGALSQPLRRRLLWLLLLGAAQGGLGWFMVASGLADRTEVSQYRLAAHLGLAAFIYAALLWTALGLLGVRAREAVPRGLRRRTAAFLGLLALTIMAGAFVAGLDAGLIYNTFPLMDGRLIPDGLYASQPSYLSPFEDAGTAQFQHRVLAYATLVAGVLIWRAARRTRPGFADALLCAVLAQFAFGVATLLLQVPVALAALHQAGGLVLLAAAVALARATRP